MGLMRNTARRYAGARRRYRGRAAHLATYAGNSGEAFLERLSQCYARPIAHGVIGTEGQGMRLPSSRTGSAITRFAEDAAILAN